MGMLTTSSEHDLHSVTSYDKQGDAEDLFFPGSSQVSFDQSFRSLMSHIAAKVFTKAIYISSTLYMVLNLSTKPHYMEQETFTICCDRRKIQKQYGTPCKRGGDFSFSIIKKKTQ
jgi:hypothetical protein